MAPTHLLMGGVVVVDREEARWVNRSDHSLGGRVRFGQVRGDPNVIAASVALRLVSTS